MPTQPGTPQTTRARIVYFCWNNFPRLILLAMIVLIIFLFVSIKKEKNLIAADKAATIAQEKPPVNVVVLPLELTTITDRINLPIQTKRYHH